MLTVVYHSDGAPVSDFEAEEYAQHLLDRYAKTTQDAILVFSTDNMFTAIRCLATEQNCTDKILFRLGNEIITINERGDLNRNVKGFCDHVYNWVARLTTWKK